ncbi:hypothetical protein [Arthrobacter sp. ISL-65]|uniref:hypothetical protein n=1 Tax=Arthrobacter sp. ISL-65 TaxID=2819112 RepID=UPI001BE8C694|nr:hypothetical protein [Arthrobacter sp. ISL-65]MBT2550098.1 hypothetical protein [Arthrobacter sp. ISL-65]
MDAEDYVESVAEVLRRTALAELQGASYEVTREDPTVSLLTACAEGKIFCIRIRGDLFQIIYDEKFVFTNVMTVVEDEIGEFSAEALREIRFVCSGISQLILSKTLFRRRPMLNLTTSRGKIWPFYP